MDRFFSSWFAVVFACACVALGCGGTSSHHAPDGGTGGASPGCSGDPSAKNVTDACGVFAQAGAAAGGDGTQQSPYATLGDAITAAESAGKRVYACAAMGAAFEETVTISAGIDVYGGFDCTGWTWSESVRTALAGPADQVALTIEKSAGGAEVEGFAITAADATASGGSSIAVIADGVTASFTRCDLASGKGADGAVGMTPSGSGQQGADAPMPTTALDGCGMQMGILGGQPGQSMCGTTDTSGGDGGNGTNQAGGGAGTDALPQPQPNAMTGADGKAGQPQTAAPCTLGDPGANGLPGAMPGVGATGLGTLTFSGYQGPLATAGQAAGSPGYGGGGGGGAKACANGFAGPAGGGGGAGGCGGQPGGAGQSAGSSFALVSLGATITLDTVMLIAVNGGAGGVGGNGQPGGQGGNGGAPGSSNGDGSVKACPGGGGGQGGRGSSGGGGLGGHSAGIAFTGTAPVQTKVTIQHGNGGSGGIGGDMDMTSPGIVGGNGLGCTTLDFSNPTSPCGM